MNRILSTATEKTTTGEGVWLWCGCGVALINNSSIRHTKQSHTATTHNIYNIINNLSLFLSRVYNDFFVWLCGSDAPATENGCGDSVAVVWRSGTRYQKGMWLLLHSWTNKVRGY